MLDIVRRSKGFTRIILGVVVIATAGTFGVALYGIWGGALSNAEQGAPDWILVVDGHSIPVREFQQRRTNLERTMRDRLQGQDFDEETLGAVVDQQAVGQILGTYLAQREAHQAGLKVLPSEVSDAIVHMPVFDRGGHFIGKKTYQEIIRSQGMDVAQFENELAQDLAADKVRLALFGVARVGDSDLEKRFRDEVERSDVSYVL
ncbi:MAG TPA: SurA N-terminal domain-containing protein, partial [Candidatus Saccharimonadales bacterium]|nr:SurA N-terminal domain-containing protein [Candidatus Saccharimonadales bacterium]